MPQSAFLPKYFSTPVLVLRRRISGHQPRSGFEAKLEPTQVAQLENEQLWKLWTANKFAETGTPGLPRPTAEQWEGVRKMTHLLCDRSAALGERFEAAREVYLQTSTAQPVQLPVSSARF